MKISKLRLIFLDRRAAANGLANQKYMELLLSVVHLREWADGIPASRQAPEWECLYPAWGPVYQEIEDYLERVKPSETSQAVIVQLFYAIARDAAAEYLADCVAQREEWLAALAEKAVHYPEYECRRQIAVRIPRLKDKKRALELLLPYLDDAESYVRRDAFFSLKGIAPALVEEYAPCYWNKEQGGDEPKITVLKALAEVNSCLLADYVMKARQSGGRLLQRKAAQYEKNVKMQMDTVCLK